MVATVHIVSARTVAAAIKELRALEEFSGRRIYRLVDGVEGDAWALLEVSHEGTGRFAVFPLLPGGVRGDTAKRGQSGVRVAPTGMHTPEHTWQTVINRARRMFAA